MNKDNLNPEKLLKELNKSELKDLSFELAEHGTVYVYTVQAKDNELRELTKLVKNKGKDNLNKVIIRNVFNSEKVINVNDIVLTF